jgi:hypothetical protein
MRPDPIEFAPATTRRAQRRPVDFVKTAQNFERAATEQPGAEVVDEAFAEYAHAVTRELVADIAAQLNTLDRQREKLSRLLQSVDTDTISG